MHLKWRRALLAVCAVLLLGQGPCQYLGPGVSKPPLPPGTTVKHTVQEKAPEKPPMQLSCDTIQYQTINVSQKNVNCELPFNYTTLFNQAKAVADGITEATNCHRRCAPAKTWVERLTKDCQGRTAGVILEFGLLCPRNTQPPAGVPMTAITPFLTGAGSVLPQPPPPVRQSIGDLTADVSTATVGCTQPVDVVEYRYREQVDVQRAPCNAAMFDFGPFVERAEKRAPAACAAVTCATGCTELDPPAVLYKTWGCNGGGNEVQINVSVQCCK